MFTGIVEEAGTFLRSEGDAIVIRASIVLEGTKVGDSISVNGCCLTVIERGDDWWVANIMEETRSKTMLGSLQPGDRVNLERAARIGDRLGGHMVQGHVDMVGTVVTPAPMLRVAAGDAVLRYVVPKGSITIDGVSLTVVNVYSDGFDVSLIPHTLECTNLGELHPGDKVNLEADVIAKYAERLLSYQAISQTP